MYDVWCPAPGDRVRFHFDANSYIDVVLKQTIEQALAHSEDAASIQLEAGNLALGPQTMHIEVDHDSAGPYMTVRLPDKLNKTWEKIPQIYPYTDLRLQAANRKDRDGAVPESR